MLLMQVSAEKEKMITVFNGATLPLLPSGPESYRKMYEARGLVEADKNCYAVMNTNFKIGMDGFFAVRDGKMSDSKTDAYLVVLPSCVGRAIFFSDGYGGIDSTLGLLNVKGTLNALVKIASSREDKPDFEFEIYKADVAKMPAFFGDFPSYELPSNCREIKKGILEITADGGQVAYFQIVNNNATAQRMTLKFLSDSEIDKLGLGR